MGDTGDGGNSSYYVARLLAQPSLHASNDCSLITLPCGDLLLIGGDLAYPNPSTFSYCIFLLECLRLVIYILKFGKKKWRFDFIGEFIYFILTFSMFPLV